VQSSKEHVKSYYDFEYPSAPTEFVFSIKFVIIAVCFYKKCTVYWFSSVSILFRENITSSSVENRCVYNLN